MTGRARSRQARPHGIVYPDDKRFS